MVKAIKLGDAEPVNTFSGCGHHTESLPTKSGTPGNVMVWQMHKFMRCFVGRYENASRDATPGYVLEECSAPSINEDELPNPVHTGLLNANSSSHGCVCPYCAEAFASQDVTPVKTSQEAATVCKHVRDSQATLRYDSSLTLVGNERIDGSIAAVGILAIVACSVIMKVF